MKVLLIDNFDSFTYNLYQYLGELCEQIEVVRNNQIPLDQLANGEFTHIVISPGPGNPTNIDYFGGSMRVIDTYHKTIPILGVCLGHQGIGAYFGAKVIKAPAIMHGKVSTFKHSGHGILANLPDEITVMRYHSLVIDKASIPAELIVDGYAEDGSIMAVHHEEYPMFGVQFHPESFRTVVGKQILQNFINIRNA
jgi:anthranilate synthase component 2